MYHLPRGGLGKPARFQSNCSRWCVPDWSPRETKMPRRSATLRNAATGSLRPRSPASRVEVVVARRTTGDCVLEVGGGRWRTVEEIAATSSGADLHQPPRTSTILHALRLTISPASGG